MLWTSILEALGIILEVLGITLAPLGDHIGDLGWSGVRLEFEWIPGSSLGPPLGVITEVMEG